MNTLFTIIAVLVILASVLLTIVVLLQNGKGGGLASNFVAGNQTFGVRQTADILEKITWGLAVFILVLSIITNFTHSNAGQSDADKAADKIKKEINEGAQQAFPFTAAPAAAEQENPEAAE